MENKLKISENTVVHCETEELANEVLRIVDSLGCPFIGWNRWSEFKENTCYNFNKKGDGVIAYDNKNHISIKNFEIISAEDFIALHDIEEQNIALYKKEMENVDYKFDTMAIEGIKELNGKKDYSEINLEILDLMADRFAANKHKYPKGNMKKPIEVKNLEWALFRHIKKLVQPIENDEESYTDHLSAILCNASMILDQLKLCKNQLVEN